MSATMTENKPMTAEFDTRRATQSERDARRDEISRAQEEFNSPEFVKINDFAYRKTALLKVAFGDTKIYARFETGDNIEVTPEQLRALTS